MRKTKRIGRYHLINRIAFGGMAEIYRGFTFDAEGYKRDVAIKRLLPHYVEDGSFVDMLTDEFKVVSRIKHPNVAEVYELVDVEGSLLISMEYVDGKDLRSIIERASKKQVPLDADDMLYVVHKTLLALHHAHVARDEFGNHLQIVHRDYSPSNVIISHTGVVKLCDFGIAKAVDNRVQTKAGIIKGKVKYMSPEQAYGKKLDGRSDVFAVGSVLYELLSGHPAFSAENEVELIFVVRDAAPVPLSELCPDLPVSLVKIVEKAMSRSRSSRYASAKHFADDIAAFMAEHHPNYQRSKLAKLMKKLWRAEIEEDLRLLEDLALDDSDMPQPEGRNLIEDALDIASPVHGFHAQPRNNTSEIRSKTSPSKPTRPITKSASNGENISTVWPDENTSKLEQEDEKTTQRPFKVQ